MTTNIAFLRAVNVAGHGRVAMADLRAMMMAAGFSDVQTVLQSGNVVFAGGRAGAALEARLEQEAARRLDLKTDFLVRSAKEWREVIAANPFPDEAEHDPGHLVVMVLKGAPSAKAVDAVQAAVRGREQVRGGRTVLYITYPDGIGRSKLTGAMIESKLDIRGTARNWNTVMKLGELTAV
jgi:uncharacterized protein (DUF1697 family)